MATTVTLKPNAIDLSGSTSGTTTLQASAVAGTTTVTLPAATDTLVGKATTDTLTNKTLTSPTMTAPVLGTPASGTVTNLTGTASININGTVGATTATTGAFTTLTASGAAALGGATLTGLSSGEFGLNNSAAIRVRNAANNAYLALAYVDGSNNVRWGTGTGNQSWDVAGTGTVMTLTSTGLNSTVIGATTPAAGSFTTLTTTNGATLKTVNDGFVDVIDTSEVSGQGTGIRFANYVATDGFRKAGIFYKSVGDGASRGNLIIAATASITSQNVTSADAVITVVGSTLQTQIANGLAVTGGTLSATYLLDLSAATAGQIKFPATQNASSDANTLDDYEEGTWTPIDSSGASLSFTGVVGTYTKVGRLVTVLAEVTYPTTTNVSSAVIGGLPFTSSGSGAGINGYIRYTTVANTVLNFVSGGTGSTGVSLLRPGVNVTNVSMSAGTLLFAAMYYV